MSIYSSSSPSCSTPSTPSASSAISGLRLRWRGIGERSKASPLQRTHGHRDQLSCPVKTYKTPCIARPATARVLDRISVGLQEDGAVVSSLGLDSHARGSWRQRGREIWRHGGYRRSISSRLPGGLCLIYTRLHVRACERAMGVLRQVSMGHAHVPARPNHASAGGMASIRSSFVSPDVTNQMQSAVVHTA